MTRWLAGLALWTSVAACASNNAMLDAGTSSDTGVFAAESDADAPSADVESVPANSMSIEVQPLTTEVDGRAVLLQTFGPFLAPASFQLEMLPAVTVSGTIRGEVASPWRTIPTEDQTITAAVTILRPGTAQSYSTSSDASDGRFSVDIVPGAAYRITAVPDTPEIAYQTLTTNLLEDVDLTLQASLGAPLWGQVTDSSGDAIEGVEVEALTVDDVRATSTVTDTEGWYLMRVPEGLHTVRVIGRAQRREPTLEQNVLVADEAGDRLDFVFQDQDNAVLSGRVVNRDGSGIAGVTVRLEALVVEGYGTEATYTSTTTTTSTGNFDIRTPPGTYDIEILPAGSTRLTASVQEAVELDDTVDLGTLTLEGFTDWSTRLLDTAGAPVAGGIATCTERTSLARFWESEADTDGVLVIGLPDAEVDCTFTPPTTAVAVAITRQTLATDERPSDVTLNEGIEVNGEIFISTDDGIEPVSFAIVRLRDTNGLVWGSTVTDDNGAWTVWTDWEAP